MDLQLLQPWNQPNGVVSSEPPVTTIILFLMLNKNQQFSLLYLLLQILEVESIKFLANVPFQEMSGLFSPLGSQKFFVLEWFHITYICFFVVQVNPILQVRTLLPYGLTSYHLENPWVPFIYVITLAGLWLQPVHCTSILLVVLWINIFKPLILLFSVKDVMSKLQEYVDDINENVQKLESRGPVSKYVLPDENLRGRWDFVYTLHHIARESSLPNSLLNFLIHNFFPWWVYVHLIINGRWIWLCIVWTPANYL